ncbi:MAG: hypothetical protein ACRDBG_00535, partial [Waterburya sp.]
KQGFAEVILEENLTEDILLTTINSVYNHRVNYIKKMENWNSDKPDGIAPQRSLSKLFDLITQ